MCHLPRIAKNIYEIAFTKTLNDSGKTCSGLVNPAQCLAHFNNFILVINASSGFFVYCFIGTFGQKFMDVLMRFCRKNSAEEEAEMVEIRAGNSGSKGNFQSALVIYTLEHYLFKNLSKESLFCGKHKFKRLNRS